MRPSMRSPDTILWCVDAQKDFMLSGGKLYEPVSPLPEDCLRNQQIILEKQTLDIFESRHANALLERLGRNAQFVVFGVVTEYCVRFAAKGLLERNRRVCVVSDAIETLSREAEERTISELAALGANFVTTDEALTRLTATAG